MVNTVEDAVAVIGDNRLYAACANRKHRDTKAFYRDVRSSFGKK